MDNTTSGYGAAQSVKLLRRPREGRWVAGVCAGLADRFGISRGVVRLLFVLSILLPGPQILIYLAAWLIIPNADRGTA